MKVIYLFINRYIQISVKCFFHKYMIIGGRTYEYINSYGCI